MNVQYPTLALILAMLVLLAAFVLAVVGQMAWLSAGLFMGLALAVLVK